MTPLTIFQAFPSIWRKTATNLIRGLCSIKRKCLCAPGEVKPPRQEKALEEHYDMAVMSKELAQICITCPIPFAYEDAKIENLYTPGAYQYMKRLEFKSILARFDVWRWAETLWKSISGAWRICPERSRFLKGRKAEQVGCQLISGEFQVAGLTICIGEEEIYTIPAAGFPDRKLPLRPSGRI